MKSLNSKIKLTIIVISASICILIGIVSTYNSSKAIEEQIDMKLISISEKKAYEFNGELKKVEGYVEAIETMIEHVVDINRYKNDSNYKIHTRDKLDRSLKAIVNSGYHVEGIFFATNPKFEREPYLIWYEKIDGQLEKLQIHDNKTKEIYCIDKGYEWFDTVSMSYCGIWDDLRIGQNEEIAGFAKPIYIEGEFFGIVSINLNVKPIIDELKNFKVYKTGHAFIIDGNKNISLCTNEMKYAVDRVKFKMNRNSDMINYMDKKISYSRLKNGWVVGIVAPRIEAIGPVMGLNSVIIFFIILCIVLSIFAAKILAHDIYKPIEKATAELKYIELGEFHREFSKELLDRDDELGTFIRSVEMIQNHMRNLEGKMKKGDCFSTEDLVNDEVAVALDEIIKKAKDEIEDRMKLEETIQYEKIKNQFFANLSHELKTPLNIIFSSIQLLSTYNRENTNFIYKEKNNKHLSIIRQNCYRLLRLINNIIDITRIDSEAMKLNLINGNIVEIVENITLSTVTYVESKNKKIIFDTEIEEATIGLDVDKIERIILNLISNAIKFTNDKGMIIVSIRKEYNHIVIKVKDNGIGIPKDKLHIIFEKFRRIDTSLNRKAEGSGIGLSLVKYLVELHGGNIKAESVEGRGSAFIISLPFKMTDIESDMKFNLVETDKIEKMNIEFSDIYS